MIGSGSFLFKIILLSESTSLSLPVSGSYKLSKMYYEEPLSLFVYHIALTFIHSFFVESQHGPKTFWCLRPRKPTKLECQLLSDKVTKF